MQGGLGKGIGVAFAAALVGGAVWAAITIVTDYQIGFLAIGVGALVGFAVAKSGAHHPALPAIAGAIALLGCFLGDLAISAYFFGEATGLGFGTAVSEMAKDAELAQEVYEAGFEAITLLFYGLAAVAAFRFTTAGMAERQPDPV